jgi:2-methylcitrate dehydratase
MNLEKKSLASGVTVFFTDGTVSEEILVEFPVGHVRNPETAAAVKEKFRKNIALKFSNEEAVEILEAVEMPDMGISEFVDLFVRNKQTEAKL